jgi:hypothetical protein
MMHLNLVSFEPETVWNRPEGWRMKSALKGWWRNKLAALCWHILHKLHAVEAFQYSEKIYRYGDTEQGKVTDLILKSVDAVLRHRGVPEDYCIVLGAKEFSELMRDMPIHEGFTVPAGRICRANNVYRDEFRGLPVHVVPHLSGVAVLPKVIVENRRSVA